jgi:hypothetical protein
VAEGGGGGEGKGVGEGKGRGWGRGGGGGGEGAKQRVRGSARLFRWRDAARDYSVVNCSAEFKGTVLRYVSAPHLRSWSQQTFINDKFRNSLSCRISSVYSRSGQIKR